MIDIQFEQKCVTNNWTAWCMDSRVCTHLESTWIYNFSRPQKFSEKALVLENPGKNLQYVVVSKFNRDKCAFSWVRKVFSQLVLTEYLLLFVYCIQTDNDNDIVKFLSRPSSPIILVYWAQAPLPTLALNAEFGLWQIFLCFSTEISAYQGKLYKKGSWIISMTIWLMHVTFDDLQGGICRGTSGNVLVTEFRGMAML